MRRLHRIDPLAAIQAAVLLYLAAFLFYPFVQLVASSLRDLSAAAAPLPPGLLDQLLRLTRNSLSISLTATVVALLLALPVALFATKVKLAYPALFYVLLTLPLVTPPFISSFATILLFGRTGTVTQLLTHLGVPTFSIYGFPGLLVTHVLHFTPYAFLLISAGLRTVPRHVEEAAWSLGSGFWQVQRRVVLPYIWPHVLAGGMLVFLASFGDVGAALLVGGSFRVLPAEIYATFVSLQTDPRVPVVFGAWTIGLCVILLAAARYLLLRSEMRHQFRAGHAVYTRRGLVRLGGAVCLSGALLLFLPYAAIFIASIGTVWSTGMLPDGWTLRHYQWFLTRLDPLWNSLKLVALSAPLTVALSLFVSRITTHWRLGPLVDYLVQLPFVVPGVVLGVGLIKAYHGRQFFGFELAGSAAVLVIAYSVRRLAHSTRSTGAGFARIDRRLEEAALSLGASPARTFWRVTLPQLRYVLVAAMIIVFTKTITELSATLMVRPPNIHTMSTMIFEYTLEGFVARAAAMAMVLLAIVAAGTGLANLMQRRQHG